MGAGGGLRDRGQCGVGRDGDGQAVAAHTEGERVAGDVDVDAQLVELALAGAFDGRRQHLGQFVPWHHDAAGAGDGGRQADCHLSARIGSSDLERPVSGGELDVRQHRPGDAGQQPGGLQRGQQIPVAGLDGRVDGNNSGGDRHENPFQVLVGGW